MQNTNKIMTAESVVNSISDLDVRNYIDGLKEVTEKYLYYCAKEGEDPDYGYNALINATSLLNEVLEYNQKSGSKLNMVAGM